MATAIVVMTSGGTAIVESVLVAHVQRVGSAKFREEDLVQAVQTLASVQSCARRQHVTPLQPIASIGRSAQVTPLSGMQTIPLRAARSSASNRPRYCRRDGG